MSTAPTRIASATHALDVREISVSYGGIRAVDEVSFSVARGAIVGLIGPNGAGKTTVFDAICGFVQAERGQVVLDGKDITRMASPERARAGLGRSFQDARLFPSLTVEETLAVSLERHIRRQDPVSTALRAPWVRKAERDISRRADELIELMGLSAFRDKFIAELSTGSRRIVDLACVLAYEPVVLLLDEPSSGIAQKETEALGPLLLRVKETTGCTMVLIEHDMPLVTAVSDELIALETGRVIARGSPREVTTDPRVVEAYLGTDQRIIARSGEALREVKRKAPATPRAGAAKAKPAATRTRKKPAAETPARKKPAAAKKGAPTRRRKKT